MESEVLIGVLIRLLPALVVAGLAFFAAADRKTRERWGDLLYQMGSIRPDQREDPKIGSGVKWPFFVVALGLLLWPVQYYRHASTTIDAASSDLKPQAVSVSDLKKLPSTSTANAASNATSNAATSTPAPLTGDLKPAPAAPPGQP